MKTLVIFYSYSGHTKAFAEKLAADESTSIVEIKDIKRPGKLKAYTVGCLAAIRGKAWPIQPLDAVLADYDRLILFAPIWASNPPPAFNAMLELLPKGKIVAVKMVSVSGQSKCKERLDAIIKSKNGTLESFEDVKA